MKSLKKNILIGVLAFLLGSIISPLVVDYISYNFFEKKQIKEQEKIMVVREFIEDLERIKVIAPSNVALSECIAEKSKENFKLAYETCFQKIRQQNEEASSLLKENLAPVRIFFGGEFLQGIEEEIKLIDSVLYEMQNNQFVIQGWRSQDCPDYIDIIKYEGELTEKMLPRDENDNIRCALVLEDRGSFLERTHQDTSGDCLSAIKGSSISKENINKLIIPGKDKKFDDYILEKNSILYSTMLYYIDNLLKIIEGAI